MHAAPSRKARAWLIAALLLAAAACRREPAAPGGAWREVLNIDLQDARERHRVDLGNKRMLVVSRADTTGWEVAVYDYPVRDDSPNLLAPPAWEGAQVWMVYAWMKHRRLFPDDRVLPYGDGPDRVRIRLIDARTRRVGDDMYEFTSGRLAVWHSP